MTATAETLECGGAKGEMSFEKIPGKMVNTQGDGVAFVITISRDGRTIERKHEAEDFMGLECQRPKLGRELFVYESYCSGSGCVAHVGIIDPLDLRVLVAPSDNSFSKALKILGTDSKFRMNGVEKMETLTAVRARLYPKFTRTEVDAAINRYERGEVAEAIDLFRDLAKRNSAEASDRLGSMYMRELDRNEARSWCSEAGKHGPTKCWDIIRSRDKQAREYADGRKSESTSDTPVVPPMQLEIGMTKLQVERLYGPPTTVKTTRTAEDQVEVWFYGKKNAFLFFNYRGRLSMIQE